MRKGYKYPVDGMGCIYAITHPKTKEVRYIGQTCKTLWYRLRTHINSAKLPGSNMSKTPIGKWILKLLNEGMYPEIVLIEAVPLVAINEAEIKYIKDGHSKYRLLNVAIGGVIQGRKKGSKQTKEFCERQSRERSGTKNNNFIDYTGFKFNKLTVLKLHGFSGYGSDWICLCECGKTTIVNIKAIRRRKSCGCAKKDRWTKEEKNKLSEYNKRNRITAPNGQLLPKKAA